jgi:hypothetical protein
VIISEVSAALRALDPPHRKEFFFLDDAKKIYSCPRCLEGHKHLDNDCEFVQLIGPDSMQCIICQSNYSMADYKRAILDYYAFLDPEEQAEIREELDELR